MKTSRKNSKQRSRKLKKIAKRLAAYSAAAAATVMTTQDRTANATEVVWDIVDVTTDSSTYGTFFNMITGGTLAATYGYYFGTEAQFRLGPDTSGYIFGPSYSYAGLGDLAFIGAIQQVVREPLVYDVVFADPLPGGSSLVSAADNFNPPPPPHSIRTGMRT